MLQSVRVIAAVSKREWILFLRYPGMLLGSLVWPLGFPFFFILFANSLGGAGTPGYAKFTDLAGTRDIMGFMVIGTNLWMWVNITLWVVGNGLRNEQTRGTLEVNWLAPIPRFAYMVGLAVSFMTTSMATFVVAIAIFHFVFGLPLAGGLGPSLVAFLAGVPWMFGLGILFGSLVIWAKQANGLVHLVRGIFLVFGGMTYPIAVLPAWGQRIAWALPYPYAADALRRVLLRGDGLSAVAGDLVMLLIWGAGLSLAGWAAFLYTDRRMLRQGTVSHY